ncbi:SMI1/KNR4 family protein [Frigoriglobus tundricola]|uniref:Knr4/Smi1-like domain-containing protein n=1 Tax=Frigoriglobus tundricola TaxID=2774151 RepID=A0A6M5YZL1_9BACT|nr:SMI1/KNR4 family protein [Frigoriglobus tundricola]QJW99567.1 hypothetical protein FTUN_7179 [Frigoriglobus tundricola]
MAKQKKVQPWDTAFRRVRGVYSPDRKYPPKPSSADLDAAEDKLGFKFPFSYRAFAEAFGLDGDINDSLPLIMPLERPSWTGSEGRLSCVLSETHFYRTNDWTQHSDWDEGVPAADFFRRLVIFAEDSGYHDWAFDSADMRDPELREYRIYDIDRSSNATIIADSFDAWLLTIGERYRFEHDEEPEPFEFAFVYKPDSLDPKPIDYVRRTDFHARKDPPVPVEVTLWLAWNNHTVRDLARSIRDHGRIDAFPVLADALQDAGCTNADLLDSCRTGDPDIDGVWVLQVLLGKA